MTGTNGNQVSWTSEMFAELERVWPTGMTTSKIAQHLAKMFKEPLMNKSRVIGAKNRMRLKSRPSPLAFKDGRPSIKTPKSETRGPVVTIAVARAIPPLPEKLLPVVLVREVARFIPPPRHSDNMCRWPIGTPGNKEFRFCDDKAVHGHPYCDHHCLIAYPGMRARREAEAAGVAYIPRRRGDAATISHFNHQDV